MTTTLEWWDWFSQNGISLTETQVRDWQNSFGSLYSLDGGEVGFSDEAVSLGLNDGAAPREIRHEVEYLRREVWQEAV